MKQYNKITVRLCDGFVDELTDNYSHAEFSDDECWFMVYETEDRKYPIGWYRTDCITSLVITKCEA